jgi:Magnesium chelatase, subunit ChlI
MMLPCLSSLKSGFTGVPVGIPRGSGKAEGHVGVLTIMSCWSAPPGAGKSMLARRLTTILPEMTLAEAIETTRIHSVAGLTDGRAAPVTSRPFRGGLCYSITMSTGNSSDG